MHIPVVSVHPGQSAPGPEPYGTGSTDPVGQPAYCHRRNPEIIVPWKEVSGYENRPLSQTLHSWRLGRRVCLNQHHLFLVLEIVIK